MTDLNVKPPIGYNLYQTYIKQFKTFYDILGNSQYQFQIQSDRTIYYKDKSQTKWTRIQPPRFRSQHEVILELEQTKHNLIINIQEVQLQTFLQPTNQVTEPQINSYNLLIKELNQIEQQIADIKALELGDINQKILAFLDQRNQILGGPNDQNSLTFLLQSRQLNYTFDGESVDDYEKWKVKWELTPEYQNWKYYNQRYYEELQKLHQIDTDMVSYYELQKKLNSFNNFHLISPPIFETNSDGPSIIIKPKEKILSLKEYKAFLKDDGITSDSEMAEELYDEYLATFENEILSKPKVKILTKPTPTQVPIQVPTQVPTQVPIQVPIQPPILVSPTGLVPKIPLKVKTCKPDATNATKPEFVCSPESGYWVKVDGQAGQAIISKYPTETLKFSEGTDLSLLTNLPPSISTIIESTQPIPIVAKTPILTKPTPILTKPTPNLPVKIELPSNLPVEVQPPIIESIQTKKDQNLEIIKQIIKESGKEDVIAQLKPTLVGPIVKLMLSAGVKDDFPAVRTYLTTLNQNKNDAYLKIKELKLNTMVLASILAKIYKKIKEST